MPTDSVVRPIMKKIIYITLILLGLYIAGYAFLRINGTFIHIKLLGGHSITRLDRDWANMKVNNALQIYGPLTGLECFIRGMID